MLLASYRSHLEAELVASTLRAEGFVPTVMGNGAVARRAEVHVLADEAEACRKLLDEIEAERHDPSTPAPWTCAHCGEAVGDTFAACWNCGADRQPT